MEEFLELGLSKNEAKAYEVLVRFGKLSAGEVSGRSGVPYSRVYDVLESLVEKGLVEVVPEKTKKFVPGNPERFEKLIEERREKIDKAAEKVKELKKFYDVEEKNPVKVGIGRKAFYEIANGMKSTDKYSYNIRWSSEYKPIWVEKTRRSIKKGMDIKNLVRFDEETKKDVKDWMKIHKNFKQFDNEGVAMSIVDNEEIMIALIKSNATLLIKDKAFVDVMRRLFLAAYEKADKIG
jgi:sugar-specific transcriptional regulator TrmB